MAGDADSDSNIKQSPDSSAGDNVERAQSGDASSREAAESSDARSSLSNEAVREFENSSRAGNSSVAAESQARQDTASEHLPSVTLEDRQSQANQATSERQAQRESAENSRAADQQSQPTQSTDQPTRSADQQANPPQSADRQEQQDARQTTQNVTSVAQNERGSAGDTQQATGAQQVEAPAQQAVDQQTQRDSTIADNGREAAGDQLTQSAQQQLQATDQQTQDQQRQTSEQESRSEEQQTAAREPQSEYNVQQAQHESEHDRQEQSDDQQNDRQQDPRDSDSENQADQKPDSTDRLPETDSWDFNGNDSNQEQDQREAQNQEQSPQSDKLPETDSWDFGNPNTEKQDQVQDEIQRDDQPSDKLPEVDDWKFGDGANNNEGASNPQNEDNLARDNNGNTTELPNTVSGEANTDGSVQNNETANQHSTLNDAAGQNNINASSDSGSDLSRSGLHSNLGTVERNESLEKPAASENAEMRSLSSSNDSATASSRQNQAVEPSAGQNVENATKDSTVSGPSQNQDGLQRSIVSSDTQGAVVPESKSPAAESEARVAAISANEPSQVEAMSSNTPKESEKHEPNESSAVAPVASNNEKGEPNAVASHQPDGDDSPSSSAKDSKPETQDRVNPPTTQGINPAFVASPGVAATQARADAQLAGLPIRPLTSGFLEKASSERSALNAMALNSKSLQGKFAGEQSKIGKDGKPSGTDRKSFDGAKGLDGRQGPFDPRFGGISKVEGKAGRILKRRLAASGEKHYLTGIEIALAAAITAAAIAKKRNGVSDEQAAGEIAESQLAELLGDLNADSTKVSAQDSAMYRSSVNHFKRPTHLVQPNESLTSIAEDYFGDSDVAWLIADINAGLINQHFEDGRRIIELNSRAEIELPLPSEITEFFSRKQKNQNGESIITIIKESEIDSELLNSFLGNVVGIGSGANSPVLEPVALSQLKGATQLATIGAAPVSMTSVLNGGGKLNTFVSEFDLPKLAVSEN